VIRGSVGCVAKMMRDVRRGAAAMRVECSVSVSPSKRLPRPSRCLLLAASSRKSSAYSFALGPRSSRMACKTSNRTIPSIAIALQFIWAAILAGGMLLLPESPRFLIRKGRDERAAVSLVRLLSPRWTTRLWCWS
jgi:hypothetical protein